MDTPREQGTGNREQGTENREQRTENREQGTVENFPARSSRANLNPTKSEQSERRFT
jgi:hypothetical protein